MTWLLLLLVGCGLMDSPEALQKGPAPVVEGPVTVDGAAQERARAVADKAAAAAGGTAEDCVAAIATAAKDAAGGSGASAGAFATAEAAGEGTPLWAQAWALEHPTGGAEPLDEIVETPEGRFAHLIRPVPGCGVVWVEAQVTSER